MYFCPILLLVGPFSYSVGGQVFRNQWLPNLSESSGLHRCPSIECSSLSMALHVVISGTVQAREKSTKINFFGPETAGWGGGLPPEGVGVEKFVPSLESLSSLGFGERNLGCPGNFAGMSRIPGGVPKICAKKVRVHFSFPNSAKIPGTSVFAPLCCKSVCCASRFGTRGRGAVGSRSKQMPKELCSKC